LEQKSQS